MHKFHVTLVALLVAVAAVLGAVAVTRTTGLGSTARHANDASLASREKQLSTYASKLQQELKATPPALPKVPKHSPAAAAQRPTAQIVYHRPPPVIHVVHHHGDDGSGEAEGGGGGDG